MFDALLNGMSIVWNSLNDININIDNIHFTPQEIFIAECVIGLVAVVLWVIISRGQIDISEGDDG